MAGQENQQYTVLYGRLSQEDERAGESNSIQHQRTLLEKYAKEKGFENTIFLADDGYSGTNFERPAWKKIVEMIEAGQVANLIVKDASRLGREYLQVGYYMEIYFPQKNVRFIAVNDGVDSTVESSNDFNPIRNWANELHAKDTSRKVRAVMKMKAEQGERLGGRPPYGYRKSNGDANTLVPDEDTAPVVKRIFSLCAAGNGPKRIATILTKEQVVNPSNAYYRKTGKSHRGLDTTRPCLWSSNSVTSILNNEVYLGHSVGLRTTTISYKNKQRVERPESERFVVKNTHEALVTQEQWDIVQEVRQHKKRVPKHMDEPNIFSGLVFCADCGKPLVLHRASTMKRTEYNFKCYTYGKKGKTVCTPHHIREFELKAVVLEDLRRVTHFARMKEKQFAAYISSKNTLELRRELVPELTVEQNIIFPVLLDYQKPDKKYLEELLTVLNLQERRNHLPSQLSGGQQQRVAIGRALITRPSLILADEPTGNLDTQNSSEVIALLKEASKKYEQTIIMITHNRSIAQTADRVLQVSDGVLTDFGRHLQIPEYWQDIPPVHPVHGKVHQPAPAVPSYCRYGSPGIHSPYHVLNAAYAYNPWFRPFLSGNGLPGRSH